VRLVANAGEEGGTILLVVPLVVAYAAAPVPSNGCANGASMTERDLIDGAARTADAVMLTDLDRRVTFMNRRQSGSPAASSDRGAPDASVPRLRPRPANRISIRRRRAPC
jgi:hypothetical protein